MAKMVLQSLSEHEQRVANAFPAGWMNPTPLGRYNLVVVGGDTAGIISALTTAGLQGRVALIQRPGLGADSLNSGYTAGRTLLRAVRSNHQTNGSTARGNGQSALALQSDFAIVAERLSRSQAEMSQSARFRLAAHRLRRRRLPGHRALSARTRSKSTARNWNSIERSSPPARAPARRISGLDEVGYQTSDSIFSLDRSPRTLVVIGGGPGRLRAGPGLSPLWQRSASARRRGRHPAG